MKMVADLGKIVTLPSLSVGTSYMEAPRPDDAGTDEAHKTFTCPPLTRSLPFHFVLLQCASVALTFTDKIMQ